MEDPSVIVHDDGTVKEGTVLATSTATSTEEQVNQDPVVADAQIVASKSTVRDFFHWKPQHLLDEYMKDKTNKDAQDKLFTHMTNFTAQMTWNADKNQALEPSAHLDPIVSEDQKQLLCPSYTNILTGFIL